MLSVLWVFVGLIALLWASDIAVDESKHLAASLGVSPLLIGVTLGAIGTSVPEIATNVAAAMDSRDGADASGVAIGSIVGSCLSQITLLVGVTALVRPLTLDRASLKRDGTMAVVALFLMLATCLDGQTGRYEALGLVALYVGYVVYAWRSELSAGSTEAARTPWLSAFKVLVSVVVVAVGADLLVENTVRLAMGFGVDQDKLGLFLGLATGIPELVLAVKSMRAQLPGLAVGNLVGSNITDPMASFGLGAALHPVTVPEEVLLIDFPVWALSTVVVLAMLATQRGVTRARGAALCLSFGLYAIVRGGL